MSRPRLKPHFRNTSASMAPLSLVFITLSLTVTLATTLITHSVTSWPHAEPSGKTLTQESQGAQHPRLAYQEEVQGQGEVGVCWGGHTHRNVAHPASSWQCIGKWLQACSVVFGGSGSGWGHYQWLKKDALQCKMCYQQVSFIFSSLSFVSGCLFTAQGWI